MKRPAPLREHVAMHTWERRVRWRRSSAIFARRSSKALQAKARRLCFAAADPRLASLRVAVCVLVLAPHRLVGVATFFFWNLPFGYLFSIGESDSGLHTKLGVPW